MTVDHTLKEQIINGQVSLLKAAYIDSIVRDSKRALDKRKIHSFELLKHSFYLLHLYFILTIKQPLKRQSKQKLSAFVVC